jgi:hypothetical protein
MKRLIPTVAAALLGAATLAQANTWTAELLPASGELIGPAGSTLGWGYTLTNESDTFWLVPWNLDSDTFEQGTPNSLFLFPILGPNESTTVLYDGVDGLFEFTWDVTAPLGFQNVGLFEIFADWFDGDPFGQGSYFDDAGSARLPYSVTVGEGRNGGGGPVIPEPSTLSLAALGLAALAARRRLRRG